MFLWIQFLARVGCTNADLDVDMSTICIIDAEIPVRDYTPIPTIPLVYLDKYSPSPVEAILEHNCSRTPKHIHPITRVPNLAPRIFIEVDPSQMITHGLVDKHKTKIITKCKPSEVIEPGMYYLFLVGGLILVLNLIKEK